MTPKQLLAKLPKLRLTTMPHVVPITAAMPLQAWVDGVRVRANKAVHLYRKGWWKMMFETHVYNTISLTLTVYQRGGSFVWIVRREGKMIGAGEMKFDMDSIVELTAAMFHEGDRKKGYYAKVLTTMADQLSPVQFNSDVQFLAAEPINMWAKLGDLVLTKGRYRLDVQKALLRISKTRRNPLAHLSRMDLESLRAVLNGLATGMICKR
jgi:hypothetical protein